MKFKNILALALCATAVFTACETVDEDERFEGPVEFTPKKNVLIEDFTGQRCINCPNASSAIHTLQNTYGKDHVIAVALHGGALSIPAPNGLATPESQEYNTHWNVEIWPNGLINRKGGLLEFSAWSAKVVEELQQEPGVELDLTKSSYDADKRQLTVNVELLPNISTTAQLQVWLTENDIKTIQIMPDGHPNKDYVHNHVFRTSVNGTWGEDIEMKAGEALSKIYTYTIENEKWNPENMSIVAFVSNASGVLQVVENSITK